MLKGDIVSALGSEESCILGISRVTDKEMNVACYDEHSYQAMNDEVLSRLTEEKPFFV